MESHGKLVLFVDKYEFICEYIEENNTTINIRLGPHFVVPNKMGNTPAAYVIVNKPCGPTNVCLSRK